MKLFDSHFHIIDYDFPVKENNGYMPPSFKVNDYLNHTRIKCCWWRNFIRVISRI